MKRDKTTYPGVTFYVKEDGEKIYYIRYRQGGRGTKETEEPVGSSASGMTPAKAAHVRSVRMNKKAPTNKEIRAELFRKNDEWTFQKLFERYQETLDKTTKSSVTDRNFFKRLEAIHPKELKGITSLDIEAIVHTMEKEGKSPQTIKHVLNIITRTNNYAVKNELVPQASSITFTIRKPKVDTHKTENMDDVTFRKYLAALDEEADQDRAAILRFALFSGMRKRAIFALKWKNIDFLNNMMELEGKVAKNRKTAFIPLNMKLREILAKLKKGAPEDYIFFSADGKQRTDFSRMARRVRQKAGLPEDFRPMHGLRHTYASRLASSGKVDLYTLQKLLTHESPEMTQRYAHLSDEAMRRAALVADEVFSV